MTFGVASVTLQGVYYSLKPKFTAKVIPPVLGREAKADDDEKAEQIKGEE